MQTACLIPFLKGCGTGAGLIIAIGPQNAFVLKQGLLKNNVFLTAFLCALGDTLLISLGVGGFGAFLSQNAILLQGAKWGGALFLFFYGAKAFREVFLTTGLKSSLKDMHRPGMKETCLMVFALTFLNPHAYLDAVVLLGGISSQFMHQGRLFFGMGAILASFIWFFCVCYGARYLAPWFQKPLAWKILDFMIGCIMWMIAVSLILPNSCLC